MTVKCDLYCRINNNCQFRGAEQTKCWNIFEGEKFHLKCLFAFLLPRPLWVCMWFPALSMPNHRPEPENCFQYFPIKWSNQICCFCFCSTSKVIYLVFYCTTTTTHAHTHTHASKQMSFNINKNLFGIFQKLLGKNSDSIMDRRVYFWSPHKHIYFCFVP